MCILLPAGNAGLHGTGYLQKNYPRLIQPNSSLPKSLEFFMVLPTPQADRKIQVEPLSCTSTDSGHHFLYVGSRSSPSSFSTSTGLCCDSSTVPSRDSSTSSGGGAVGCSWVFGGKADVSPSSSLGALAANCSRFIQAPACLHSAPMEQVEAPY